MLVNRSFEQFEAAAPVSSVFQENYVVFMKRERRSEENSGTGKYLPNHFEFYNP